MKSVHAFRPTSVHSLGIVLGLFLSFSMPAVAGETTTVSTAATDGSCADCACGEAMPTVVKPAGRGGKSSRQHAQAKAAKQAADGVSEKKAEARAAKIAAGEKPTEEKAWVWKHRAVRHKQTMPAAPTLSETETR